MMSPFKYEMLHKEPEIALIHDFVSCNEANNIIDRSREKLKSTPFEYKVNLKWLKNLFLNSNYQ